MRTNKEMMKRVFPECTAQLAQEEEPRTTEQFHSALEYEWDDLSNHAKASATGYIIRPI